MSDGWIVERGVGEDRFALIEDGEIAEAYVERPGELRVDSVHEGRLARKLGRRGEAEIAGDTCLVDPWPEDMAEGALVKLRVAREAIPERGRMRSAKVSVAASDDPSRQQDAPNFAMTSRIAGWTDVIEEARTGVVAFPGGLLTIVPTPAGTTMDIDGAGLAKELAVAGAAAAARAIRRLGLAGSILIDLPSVEGKTARMAAAEAFDAAMTGPYERTGMNGFGLLQVIRPRRRAALIERVQNQLAQSGALDLFRRAEHAGARQQLDLRAGVGIVSWLDARPALMTDLNRRTGVAARLKIHGDDPLWWGDVHAL
ncbi:MAG: ribonuclease [Pacificimonas sp.]